MDEATKPKSALFSRFKTNTDKEENGVWEDLGDGIKIKIRRFKSRAAQEARKALEEPYQSRLRFGGKLTDEEAQEILVRQMSKAIIVDWDGVTDEEGNVLPCTEGAKYEVLKALPDFRDVVASLAIDRDNFVEKSSKDGEGNS
jgi:hypothetical protein